MKIGITCYPTYGGSGVLASELGKFLAKRGHEVHFVTSTIPYRLQRDFQERIYFHTVDMDPYPVFEHPPYDLALAAKMKDVFVSEGLDVLHVHYAIPHAISAYLAAQLAKPQQLPIVTTLHGTDITLVGQERSFFDITRFGIEESTAVTAVSDYLKEETERVFSPSRPVQRVHNFVDLSLFRHHAFGCHRSNFATADQVVYIHVSNFRPVKRIPDVIKIFARVREEVDAVLILVGEGPTLREAKELAAQLGVQKHVRYLGKQLDIVSILGCSDVLLFPSEVESFGLAPLEAMACELPVVATRTGGIPEVVEHLVSGFLAPVGDVETMASHAVELGRSKELRVAMGKAGRKAAEARFSPDLIIPQYEAIYRKAAGL
ncbi:MAG: N-acetyl-alpha-D-glucosaminyl L-malate synthase BshA [Fibrobacteres bacterium]|nr:N-acetyl-alpha-D-glucosaminyl L-malate synthase BshA [Fibrobacterota bacterium]